MARKVAFKTPLGFFLYQDNSYGNEAVAIYTKIDLEDRIAEAGYEQEPWRYYDLKTGEITGPVRPATPPTEVIGTFCGTK